VRADAPDLADEGREHAALAWRVRRVIVSLY
jgi:hypothetical protein